MSVKNYKKEFEKIVPENVKKTLYLCSQAAEKLSLRIFLIGGAVRDLIAGKNHFDTDITVQGNAVEFAYFLEKIYCLNQKNCKLIKGGDCHPDICKIKEIHESFGTVKIIFCLNSRYCEQNKIIHQPLNKWIASSQAPSNDNYTPEVEIDIASTRKESYPYPASLPQVEEIGCNLYEDVKRRDFSINSMALSLNKDTFGDLTDYLGGYKDIKEKKIRVLHPESFIDDPTRIIRALKFRVRFDYELDEFTKKLQENCLESGKFDNLCGERIKSELKQTFNLNKAQILEIFMQENIYRLVDTNIKTSENLAETCESVILEYLNYINPDFIWLIYLGVLFSEFSGNKILKIAEKLYLSGVETAVLTEAKTLLEKSNLIIKNLKNCANFEIYEFFEGFMPESILILIIKKSDLKKKADLYLKELKDIKIHTTGQNLIDLGLKPGPVFSEILRMLLKAKINGEFSSKEDEEKFLKVMLDIV